jgi:hypothetical protein
MRSLLLLLLAPGKAAAGAVGGVAGKEDGSDATHELRLAAISVVEEGAFISTPQVLEPPGVGARGKGGRVGGRGEERSLINEERREGGREGGRDERNEKNIGSFSEGKRIIYKLLTRKRIE